MLRNREGFTLIELLIVVVIIGILAAIALPKFGETRERAYVSAMQSDLRNLQTAQELYYADADYTYSGDVETLPGYSISDGVNISMTASSTGYTATATHNAIPNGTVCTLTYDATDEATGNGVECAEPQAGS